MWSEVFKHDYANGDKIAIILLDTQGIFDPHISLHESKTIFALSMMLSSVQCYNLKNNIYPDDLRLLQMFTEYGRLASAQSQEKPFQYLLFTIRDWSYPEANRLSMNCSQKVTINRKKFKFYMNESNRVFKK